MFVRGHGAGLIHEGDLLVLRSYDRCSAAVSRAQTTAPAALARGGPAATQRAGASYPEIRIAAVVNDDVISVSRSRFAHQDGHAVDQHSGYAAGAPAPCRPGFAAADRRKTANSGGKAQEHHRYRRRDQKGDRHDRAAKQHETRSARRGPQGERHRAQRAGPAGDGVDRLGKAGAADRGRYRPGLRRGGRRHAEAPQAKRKRSAKPGRRDLSRGRQPAAGRGGTGAGAIG